MIDNQGQISPRMDTHSREREEGGNWMNRPATTGSFPAQGAQETTE